MYNFTTSSSPPHGWETLLLRMYTKDCMPCIRLNTVCVRNSFATGKCCTLVMQLLHIKSMPFCSFVRPSVLPRVWYWLTSSFLSYVVVNDYVCTFGTGTFLNKHRHRPRKDLLVCRLAGCTSATFLRFVVARLHLMFNPKMQFCVFVKLLQ